MRLRNIPGADEYLAKSAYMVQEPESVRGKWHNRFGKAVNGLELEIGCGKGRFITEKAGNDPDLGFVGIEQYSSVLYRRLRKLENEELPNLLFVRMNADRLEEVFDEGEADRLYLNFSDPWPKDRHAKRRLTSRVYLDIYNRILAPGGVIEFKTDNENLFDFTLGELEPAGWKALEVCRNLYADPEALKGNVQTEYEEKFTLLNCPIYKCVIGRA